MCLSLLCVYLRLKEFQLNHYTSSSLPLQSPHKMITHGVKECGREMERNFAEQIYISTNKKSIILNRIHFALLDTLRTHTQTQRTASNAFQSEHFAELNVQLRVANVRKGHKI